MLISLCHTHLFLWFLYVKCFQNNGKHPHRHTNIHAHIHTVKFVTVILINSAHLVLVVNALGLICAPMGVWVLNEVWSGCYFEAAEKDCSIVQQNLL